MRLAKKISNQQTPSIDIHSTPLELKAKFFENESLQSILVTMNISEKLKPLGVIQRTNVNSIKEKLEDYMDTYFISITLGEEKEIDKIFYDNIGKNISLIPVIDDEGYLLHSYEYQVENRITIQSEIFQKYSKLKQWGYSLSDWFYLKGYHIVGIHGYDFEAEILCEELAGSKVDISFVSGTQNKSFGQHTQQHITKISKEMVLNTDVVINCASELQGQILHLYQTYFDFQKVVSLRQVINELYNYETKYNYILKVLNEIAATGRKIFLFDYPRLANVANRSSHENLLLKEKLSWMNCLEKIKNRNKDNAQYEMVKQLMIHPLNTGRKRKNRPQIDWNEYLEYYPTVLNVAPSISYKHDYAILQDMNSKHVNIIDGCRIVPNKPSITDYNIHCFGKSWMFGHQCSDEFTVSSELQNVINEKQSASIGVINHGIGGIPEKTIANILKEVNEQADPDDVFVFVHMFEDYGLTYIRDLFHRHPYIHSLSADRPHLYEDFGEIWVDTGHIGEGGSELLARQVYDKCFCNDTLAVPGEYENHINPNAGAPVHYYKDDIEIDQFENSPELQRYLSFLKDNKRKAEGIVGSIVMNCNPFTLGHRYLIETSAKKVDTLYIFAVEEDLSIFPFADRMELIKQGVADLENVVVVPSGKFIISALTFPGYFVKGEKNDAIVDPSADVTLFGKRIAPTLDITMRFAGEEPFDKVTLQYNQSMAEILPKYGIDFEVIPRKEAEGAVISASRVRALLKEKNYEAIKPLVPQSTYDYLCNEF